LPKIHLDPPNPVPALGIGRWLGPDALAVAADALETATAVDSPLAMIELRNLDNEAHTRDGATTAVPGPFLLHAVGTATDVASRSRTRTGCPKCVPPRCRPTSDAPRRRSPTAVSPTPAGWTTQDCSVSPVSALPSTLTSDLAPSRVLAALNGV